ncbi:MAG: hypothetical protein WCS77_01635 [Elusimicrobiaceae bacterium]
MPEKSKNLPGRKGLAFPLFLGLLLGAGFVCGSPANYIILLNIGLYLLALGAVVWSRTRIFSVSLLLLGGGIYLSALAVTGDVSAFVFPALLLLLAAISARGLESEKYPAKFREFSRRWNFASFVDHLLFRDIANLRAAGPKTGNG